MVSDERFLSNRIRAQKSEILEVEARTDGTANQRIVPCGSRGLPVVGGNDKYRMISIQWSPIQRAEIFLQHDQFDWIAIQMMPHFV